MTILLSSSRRTQDSLPTVNETSSLVMDRVFCVSVSAVASFFPALPLSHLPTAMPGYLGRAELPLSRVAYSTQQCILIRLE